MKPQDIEPPSMSQKFGWLPKTPSEITVDFLKDKLHDQPWSHKIANISFNASNTQGQCSLVVLFTLSDEEGNLLSEIYIKFPKDENDKSVAHHVDRKFLVDSGAYKKEIGFYQYLLNTKSELLDRHVVPPIYFAEIDRKNLDQFLLILGKSGNALDQIVGCSTEQVRNILEQWAIVQSKFWYTAEQEEQVHAQLIEHGLDTLTPLHKSVTSLIDKDKYLTINIGGAIYEIEQVWRTKWEDFALVVNYFSTVLELENLSQNVKILSEDVSSERIFEIIDDACKLFHAKNRTLNHVDFRLDNMLQIDENCTEFIDFQSIGFGICSFDLAFFLSSCSPCDQVNHNFDSFLESYWTSLINNNSQIEKDYSLTELKRDTRKAAILQLSCFVSMFSAWKPLLDAGTDLKSVIGRFFDLVVCSIERMLNFYVKFTSSD